MSPIESVGAPAFKLPVAVELFCSRLLQWYSENRRELPWRGSSDPYHIWLSEVMLQQTRVATATPYFERFIQRYPTLEQLASAEIDEVLDLWTGLGYYRRARNLHSAAQIVRDRHGGRFPSDYDEALKLPGIGPYSAAAILSLAYSQPRAVFDGNVRRFLVRYLGVRDELKSADESALKRLLNEVALSPCAADSISEFNQALMELGALVCTPGRPHCDRCPLAENCQGFLKGIQGEIPLRRRRRKTQNLDFVVAVIRKEGGFLMCRNDGESYLEGMWEFPRIPGKKDIDSACAEFHRLFGLKVLLTSELKTVTHSITFRRMRFFPFLGTLCAEVPAESFHWIRFGEQPVPTSSYVGKIVRQVDALS